MAKGSQSFQISVRLAAKEFKNGLNKIQGQLKQFGNFIKSVFTVGSITAFGRQMIQVGSDFEDAMSRVQAVSNASAEDFKKMNDEAKRLGETTRYSASEAAGALENLTRNGLTASQATEALQHVLSFAGANAIDLAKSADILTNTMNMFGLSVSESQRVTDVMSATAASSATDVNLLYEAMVNAAPAAHTMGFSIEETAAAIGALAQKGVKGADAGTQLRMALVKMADPKIVAKMQEMGLSIDENTMKSEGLTGTLQRLKDANLELSQLISIFSQRGAAGIEQLISAYDEYERVLGETENAAGSTARMFEQGIGSTKNEIANMKSAWEGFLISLSEKTSGVVNTTIGYITHLIRDFGTLGGTIKNLAIVLIPTLGKSIVTAFRTAGAAAKTFGTTLKTLFSTNVVGLIMTAVAGLIALIDKWTAKSRELRQEHKELEKEMDNVATKGVELKAKITTLCDKLDTNNGSLGGVVKEATELMGDFKETIKEAAKEARKTGNYDALKDTLQKIADLQQLIAMNSTLQKLQENVLERGAHIIWENRKSDKMESAGLKGLSDYMSGHKFSQDQQEAVYKEIIGMVFGGVSSKSISDYINGIMGTHEYKAVHLEKIDNKNMDLTRLMHEFDSYAETIYNNEKQIKAARQKEAELEAAARAQREAEERAAAARKEAEEKAAAEREKEEKAAAEHAKKVQDVEDDLQKELDNIEDDFNNSNKEMDATIAKLKDLKDAFTDAYEKLRDLTGAKGADNKYYKGMMEANANYQAAVDKKSSGNDDIVITDDNITGSGNGNGGLTDEQIQAIKDLEYLSSDKGRWEGFKQGASAINGLGSSVIGLANAFDTLSDAEANWTDKLGAMLSVLGSTVSGVDSVISIIDAFKAASDAAALADTVNTGTQLANAESKVAANTAVAATGAASSVASIPYVGWLLAGAAVAGILALLGGFAGSFAEGGVIGGSSTHGDKLVARVNSGEMILNGSQQANLFRMLKDPYMGGGSLNNVEFHISGKDLVGTMNNYNRSITVGRSPK